MRNISMIAIASVISAMGFFSYPSISYAGESGGASAGPVAEVAPEFGGDHPGFGKWRGESDGQDMMNDRFRNMSPEDRKAFKERMQNMSPEEKQAFRERMREKMRERIQNMSPEEKQAFRERMREKMQERMKNMSPEQRRQMMERFGKNRPEGMDGREGFGGGGSGEGGFRGKQGDGSGMGRGGMMRQGMGGRGPQ